MRTAPGVDPAAGDRRQKEMTDSQRTPGPPDPYARCEEGCTHDLAAGLLTEELRKRLSDRQISLELTEPARMFIAREGYDPVYGARPLKRFLQRELETRLGRALIGGGIADGTKITVGLEDGALAITHGRSGVDAAT